MKRPHFPHQKTNGKEIEFLWFQDKVCNQGFLHPEKTKFYLFQGSSSTSDFDYRRI